MKKSTRIMLIISICLISVGIIFSAVGIAGNASWRKAVTGGMWDTMLFTSDHYGNDFRKDGTYHTRADNLHTIKIDWYYGDISIEIYNGSDILISETSEEPVTKDNFLRYRAEDHTLKILSAANTAEIRFSPENPSAEPEKDLTIKIPKSFADRLNNLKISTISSDISICGLTLENLDLSSENGDFKSRGLKADTADIYLGEGSMKADFLTCPSKLSFYANRGDCLLGLPKNSRADCSYYTLSGQVRNDFEKANGKHSENDCSDSLKNSSGNDCNGSQTHQGKIKIGRGGTNRLDLSTDEGNIRICRGSCF